MKRLFIFKVVSTGEEIVLPVTPASYEVETGRTIEALDMQEVGQLNFPGLPALLDKPIECMFPAQVYPFCNAGTVTDPAYYIRKFEAFVSAGEVLRFVVSDTTVNVAVLIESFTYGERDGTNDVYATIRLRGYREVKAPAAERTSAAQNAPRASMDLQIQQTYVVQKGDTFRSICKKFYGDESLAAKLAGYNGFASTGVLQAGTVLKIPPLASVKAAKAAAVSEPKSTPDPVPEKEPAPTSGSSAAQDAGQAQIQAFATRGAVVLARLEGRDDKNTLVNQMYLTPQVRSNNPYPVASTFVPAQLTYTLSWTMQNGWHIDDVTYSVGTGRKLSIRGRTSLLFKAKANTTVNFHFTCSKGGVS